MPSDKHINDTTNETPPLTKTKSIVADILLHIKNNANNMSDDEIKVYEERLLFIVNAIDRLLYINTNADSISDDEIDTFRKNALAISENEFSEMWFCNSFSRNALAILNIPEKHPHTISDSDYDRIIGDAIKILNNNPSQTQDKRLYNNLKESASYVLILNNTLGKEFYDTLYQCLLALAVRKPLNCEDPITGNPMKNPVFLATGEKINQDLLPQLCKQEARIQSPFVHRKYPLRDAIRLRTSYSKRVKHQCFITGGGTLALAIISMGLAVALFNISSPNTRTLVFGVEILGLVLTLYSFYQEQKLYNAFSSNEKKLQKLKESLSKNYSRTDRLKRRLSENLHQPKEEAPSIQKTLPNHFFAHGNCSNDSSTFSDNPTMHVTDAEIHSWSATPESQV